MCTGEVVEGHERKGKGGNNGLLSMRYFFVVTISFCDDNNLMCTNIHSYISLLK